MADNRKYFDFEAGVGFGLSGGNSVRNIFGYNNQVGTSFVPLWENSSAYIYPTSALTMTVTNAAADNGVIIRIIGLDANYDIISEDHTLANGNTTTQQFFRINDLITISGNAVNGDITVANSGITYAKIRSGDGRNQASIFTVPRNHEFGLYRIDAFCASSVQNNRILTFRNTVETVTGVKLRVAETEFRERMDIQRRLPFVYNEKTDIQFNFKADSGTQFVSVFAEGVLRSIESK